MTRLQLETQQERERMVFEREHVCESPETGLEFIQPASLCRAYELGVRHGWELAEWQARANEKDVEHERLRKALDQAVYGCSIRMSRDHDDEIEFAAGLSFGATPELAAYLEGKK